MIPDHIKEEEVKSRKPSIVEGVSDYVRILRRTAAISRGG